MAISKTIKIVASAVLLGLFSSTLLAGDIGVEGNVTATNFIGSGAGLTGVTEVDPVVGSLSGNKWCKADATGVMINCDQDAPPAPITFQLWVPKTGQVRCWDQKGADRSCTDTGEDGEYRMGGGWVEPEDFRDWHRSFRANPRFTDNSDGTVNDNLTGLIWLKNANCIADNKGADLEETIGDGKVTWQLGLDFVKGMNTLKYKCGDTSNHGEPQTDWRLPNFNELVSIQDSILNDTVLPSGHPFSSGVLGRYWSSTTSADFTISARFVDFNQNSTGYINKIDSYHYVWPVRGGQ